MGEPQKIGSLIQLPQRNSSETQNLPSISQKSSRAISCLELFGDREKFLVTFNPDKQYSYCKDIERCFMGKAPSLRTLNEAYGENTTETWLEIQLRDLSEFAGCKEKLSVYQMEQTAKVIILNFGYLKVTELMYFFILFKGGKFGKFYGAVDGLVITEAIQDFLQIRREKLREYIMKQEALEREERLKESPNAMSYSEWQELKHLFNMGYEPERIKAEMAELRKQGKVK